jgi:hypothetical protein
MFCSQSRTDWKPFFLWCDALDRRLLLNRLVGAVLCQNVQPKIFEGRDSALSAGRRWLDRALNAPLPTLTARNSVHGAGPGSIRFHRFRRSPRRTTAQAESVVI